MLLSHFKAIKRIYSHCRVNTRWPTAAEHHFYWNKFYSRHSEHKFSDTSHHVPLPWPPLAPRGWHQQTAKRRKKKGKGRRVPPLSQRDKGSAGPGLPSGPRPEGPDPAEPGEGRRAAGARLPLRAEGSVEPKRRAAAAQLWQADMVQRPRARPAPPAADKASLAAVRPRPAR